MMKIPINYYYYHRARYESHKNKEANYPTYLFCAFHSERKIHQQIPSRHFCVKHLNTISGPNYTLIFYFMVFIDVFKTRKLMIFGLVHGKLE